jgi:hypothetical protein
MGATLLSVLMLCGLIAFDGTPLVLGAIAARSIVRFGARGASNRLFWGLLAVLLGLIAYWGNALYSTVNHYQPEGYGAAVFIVIVTVLGLPFSLIQLAVASAVFTGSLPRPFGLSSMSMWLLIGSLCWQFFFVVGLRWLIQFGVRRRGDAVVSHPIEQLAAKDKNA